MRRANTGCWLVGTAARCGIHSNVLPKYSMSVCARQTEYEELQQVAISNQRRDDRLAKVRGKEFSAKLEAMEVCRGGG